jgi:putative addiction module CopG family antidote
VTLELKPEIEAFIQKRLQSGAFSSAEEVIERALEFLSAEEDWLADNRDKIAGQIQEGWDEAQRGELTHEEGVRAEMGQFKENWKQQRRSA